MRKTHETDYYSFLGFILFGALTVFIWQFSYGYYILYPFTIMGTWFHEMGHGIAAEFLGGDFNRLEIFSDGSGVAHTSASSYYIKTNYARALISAAGLLGPPIMGAVFILMSKSFKKSTFILYIVSLAMLASVIIWVRTPVGIIVVSFMAVVFLFIAIKGGEIFKQLAVQIIGLMACLSTYTQIDYLFMKEVTVNGSFGFSDTGQIANQIGMSYWFWGVVIAVFSFSLLLTSLYYRNRKKIIVKS